MSRQCDGCLYQVRQGQRKPANVQAAERECGNCGAPLCKPHAIWNGAVAEYLCARCEVIWQRKRDERLGEERPHNLAYEVGLTLEAAERRQRA